MKRSTLLKAVSFQVLTMAAAQATLTLSDDYIPTRVVKQAITIPAGDLLANDTTDQESPISIVDAGGASYGTVSVTPEGVMYFPGRSFSGHDQFWYSATDGTDTQSTSVTINNPFYIGAGIYGAPIADYNYSQSQQNSGYLRLNIDRAGTFTAKVQVAGTAYSIKGVMPFEGTYSTQVAKTGKPVVSIDINMNEEFVLAFNGQVSYTIGDTTYNGTFDTGPSFLQIFDSDLQGTYTMAFGNGNIPNFYPGFFGNNNFAGYATLHISARGAATIIGKLADGSTFTSSTFVQANQFINETVHSNNSPYGNETIPIYGALSGGKGSFVAAIDVSTSGDYFDIPAAKYRVLQGYGDWYSALSRTSEIIDNPINVIGSTYVAPRKGQPFFQTMFSNGQMEFVATGGDFEGLFVPALLGAYPISGKFTMDFSPSEAAPQLKIGVANGTYTGSFIDPATEARANFSGVLITLPFYGEFPFGVGFFKSGTSIGQVAIDNFLP